MTSSTHHSRQRASPVESDYVSEFTRFMDRFLEQHPEELQEQETGWKIYWDKKVDLHAMAEQATDTVPTESYYYYGDETWRDTQH